MFLAWLEQGSARSQRFSVYFELFAQDLHDVTIALRNHRGIPICHFAEDLADVEAVRLLGEVEAASALEEVVEVSNSNHLDHLQLF